MCKTLWVSTALDPAEHEDEHMQPTMCLRLLSIPLAYKLGRQSQRKLQCAQVHSWPEGPVGVTVQTFKRRYSFAAIPLPTGTLLKQDSLLVSLLLDGTSMFERHLKLKHVTHVLYRQAAIGRRRPVER
jgi:hypothetical protein